MRPSRHLALSTVAGGALWGATGEPLVLPATIGAGVLVDIDHAPDLWWRIALGRRPVATFAIHAWEWLTLLVVLGIFTSYQWWLVAVVVGYGLHLITDHVFNHGGMWSYSLIYRARYRFEAARLAPKWDIEHSLGVLKAEIPPAARLLEWWRRRRLERTKSSL